MKAHLVRDFLKTNNKFTIDKSTNSMLPKIRPGQTVKIQKAQPKFGDIILFLDCNKMIVHRYYLSLGRFLLTKGDNERYFDKLWEKTNYLGKVVIRITFSELLTSFLTLVIAIPRFILKFLKKNLI